MDQREMWCSGYLRWMRLPDESSTLKPSSPTCLWDGPGPCW